MTYVKNVFEPFWWLIKNVCTVAWILFMIYLAVAGPYWTWHHLPNMGHTIEVAWKLVEFIFGAEPSGPALFFWFIFGMIVWMVVILGYVAVYFIEWGLMGFSIYGVVELLHPDEPDEDDEEENKQYKRSNESKKSTVPTYHKPNMAYEIEHPYLVPYVPEEVTNASDRAEIIRLRKERKEQRKRIKETELKKQEEAKPKVIEPVYVPPVYTPEEIAKMQEEEYKRELEERLYYMEQHNEKILETLNDMRRSMNMQEAEIKRRNNESYLDKFSKLSFTEQAALMVVGKKVWDKLGDK